PKVTLKLDYFAHTTADSAAEYLSTRAAAGNMPDVVYDDAGPLPTYLAQGWMRSLDEFAANDPDYRSYVASNLKADYTYGGKLYALPHQAHFETFLLNTDVLNALNLSMPSLSWTIGDFESYCKKATTNKYSAQEDFGSLYNSFAHNYSPATTLYGYNPASKQFDVSGLIQSTKLLLTLRSIPGLEANVLRKTSSGGVTDYTKKFGTGSYSDNFVAFHKGLTLFHGLGTWEYAIKRKTVTNFNWTMWPFPQETQGVMPYHVDHCFMTSSAKNTAAAWQVLRYLTYSYEGNIARLSMYDAANAGKYALQNNYYFPTCTHPAVAAKFKSLPKVDDTAKYLYENMGKCYRYDMVKLVPDWNNIVTSYYTQAMNTAISGTASLVDQTLTEAAAKANTVITNSWNTFNGKLATAQK
ncbi:MAG: hypothetical protein LBQ48_04140, partial [Oscillospiraceae bacterium]|nr:hypothetical protein [Oscillospiraceae bacterium]